MAVGDMNSCRFLGRLTADPKPLTTFHDGSAVVRFVISFTGERMKVGDEWADVPCLLNCEALDRPKGRKLGATIARLCRKDGRLAVEGRLKLDTWDDPETGERKSNYMLVVTEVSIIDPQYERQADPEADVVRQGQVASGFDDEVPLF